MLAHITGSAPEVLLSRPDYLAAGNRALRHQIKRRILLTDHEWQTLAEKAGGLGKLMDLRGSR